MQIDVLYDMDMERWEDNAQLSIVGKCVERGTT